MHAVTAAALIALLLFSMPAAFAQEQVMLESPSDQGTFMVRIAWTPAKLGDENAFAISFVDPDTGKAVEDVTYNLQLFFQDGSLQESREVQSAAVQKITFSTEGSYTIVVSNIDGLGESAAFNVRVTPEFPAPTALAVAFSALVLWRAGRLFR
jgi:hypothetical protein